MFQEEHYQLLRQNEKANSVQTNSMYFVTKIIKASFLLSTVYVLRGKFRAVSETSGI